LAVLVGHVGQSSVADDCHQFDAVKSAEAFGQFAVQLRKSQKSVTLKRTGAMLSSQQS
jgi:hypothetical protein